MLDPLSAPVSAAALAKLLPRKRRVSGTAAVGADSSENNPDSTAAEGTVRVESVDSVSYSSANTEDHVAVMV
jgi:hypothetical protein